MNNLIILVKWLRFLLLIKSFFEIFIHFLNPLYFVIFHNYKIHKLHNKNISTNINSSTKTVYIHKFQTIYNACILFILLFDALQK